VQNPTLPGRVFFLIASPNVDRILDENSNGYLTSSAARLERKTSEVFLLGVGCQDDRFQQAKADAPAAQAEIWWPNPYGVA